MPFEPQDEAKLLAAIESIVRAQGQAFDAILDIAANMAVGGAVRDPVRDSLNEMLGLMSEAQLVDELKSAGRGL